MKRVIYCFTIFTVLFSACNGEKRKNTPPVAEAGENRVISVDQLVELDGSQSMDAEGDYLLFEWLVIQRPEGAEPVIADMDSSNPVFMAYETGDYWFQLRVFDGELWSEPDMVQITAKADAFEPEARIEVVPEKPKKNESVFVSGAKSVDPNNNPLNFYWDVLNSPHAIEFNPLLRGFFFVASGNHDSLYRFALMVDDARFTSDYAFSDIVVANTPPVVSAGHDVELNGSEAPYGVYLNGTGSDADGDNLVYEWFIYRAIEGSNANISNQGIKDPLFTTDMQGFYVLRFRAYDGREWSVPDYITLCKGAPCSSFLADYKVTISQNSVALHPFFNATTGRYTANLSTSSLSISYPSGSGGTEERWVVLWCPADTYVTVLDPNLPQSTTVTFEGGINMVNSHCVLRFESDSLGYDGNLTYIISSSDTDTDLLVNFVNAAPQVESSDISYKYDNTRVFQRIPLSITASDADGDSLNYHWSLVSKPERAQAFFSSESNRPNPILYAGKEKDALGEYTLRVIVEDTLGGSTQRDIKVTVVE